MRAVRLAIACFALSASGCGSCGDPSALGKVAPHVAIDPASLAFGDVPVGATKHLRIALKNTGTAPLTVASADASAPFSTSLPSRTVPTGAEVPLDVAFSPTTDDPSSGTLVITSDDPATPSLSVPLTGRGAIGLVTVRPASIDLTNTSVGTTRTAEIVFSNLGLADADGLLSTDGFARPEHFSLTGLAAITEPAPFAVPQRSEVQVVLEYHPIAEGADDGRVFFEVCGDRCGVEVVVHASAAQAVVRVDPPLVDFGVVGIGMTVTKPVVVENGGRRAVAVLSIATLGSGDLSAASTVGLPATIDGNSSMAINLEYHPSSAALLSGELVVHTDDAIVPEAHVRATGRGDGPLFVTEPATVAFGVVPEPGTYERAVLLMNAGSADVRVSSIAVTGSSFGLGALPGLPLRLGSGESLVLHVTFSPVAIAEYAGALAIQTDDPAHAMVDVPLSGARAPHSCQVAIAPERVNFGLLPVGFSSKKAATLTNVGADPCLILSGAFRAPVDHAIALGDTAPSYPITLAAGEHVELAFAYTPTEQVESKANFVFTTADAVYPERHLSLAGSAAGYVDVFARPDHVDFGTLSPGCTRGTREVHLYNAGTVDVTVDAITLLGATSSEIRLEPSRVPAVVSAGSSYSFFTSYSPADLGVDQASVQLDVHDMPYPIIVPVRGEGSANPRALDQFSQDERKAVDIVFVIDDSGSMGDEQAAIAQNFRTFIGEANVRNVDFHLGITTTTVFPIPGAFVGPVMTRRTPDLETVFQQQASVGTNGSGIEQGLDAMAGAIALADANIVPNQDFRRPDVTLGVIIVSDEDDQSPASPLYYLNVLRNATARSGYFTAVVSGQGVGCGGASGIVGSGATPAQRYEEFVRLTQGTSESICSSWATTLAHLGSAAFGLKQSFVLSQAADTSHAIEVRVNGAVVSSSEWSYDPASHSIHFDIAPAERSTITVEYTPQC